jgi:serpin B
VATAAPSGSAGAEPTLPAELDAPPPASDIQALARSHNALGTDLWGAIAQKGNLAISPASIGLALGMTSLGARGETAAQMNKTMHVTLEPAAYQKANASVLRAWLTSGTGELELRVANRIFVEKTLKVEEPFLKATRDGFGAPAEPLDFAKSAQPSRKHINDWVAKQTKDKIEDLLPPDGVSADTRMVLTNALYFKGQWSSPFNENATSPKPFYADGARKITVPTMARLGRYPYRRAGDVEVVDLGYAGGRFAMSVVLPLKRDGLAAVEKTLSAATIARWTLRDTPAAEVRVELPKFKIEAPDPAISLGAALQKLGMTLAFDRQKADFTGIHQFQTPADRLLISQVFHKAFVEVNEKGTEAAAATAVSMARAGAAPSADEPKAFIVDHPFLFLLHDRDSGVVLFLGRVTEPK